MPKFKERSTSRGKWNADSMVLATKLVLQEKKSIREAALLTNIPRTTLQDKIRDIKLGKEIETTPQLGRFKCTFPETLETKLAEYVLILENRLMPLTREEFLKLAFDLAKKLNLANSFNIIEKKAGKDFYYNFLKRHPEISLRKPQSTSLARAVGFNVNTSGYEKI